MSGSNFGVWILRKDAEEVIWGLFESRLALLIE